MKTNLKNSIKFINKKAGRNLGFTVPNNYFDDFDNAIFAKIDTDSFPNETGFKTPENYFSDVENRILKSISEQQNPSKIIDFKRRILRFVPYIAAASIALFITFNTLIFKNDNSLSFESISETDLENWLESNSFNTSDIAAVLGDDFLEINDFSFAQLKTATLEDYLYSIDNQNLLNEKD